MAESKTAKYIITELKQKINEAPWSSEFTPEKNLRMIFLDDEVIKGAFYVECVWIWPRNQPEGTVDDKSTKAGTQAHKHDYDEVIAFFGTNFEDPQDLSGEVELWLDEEKHIITKSALVFVPKGMMHCPLIFRRADKPIFHFTAGMGKMYT